MMTKPTRSIFFFIKNAAPTEISPFPPHAPLPIPPAPRMDLLGPTVAAPRARHSLAQALTVLKERVGRDHLVVQRASLALVAGVVQVDLTRLDASETQIRGQFLDGFEVPGAVQFEHWKDEWRGGGGAARPGASPLEKGERAA